MTTTAAAVATDLALPHTHTHAPLSAEERDLCGLHEDLRSLGSGQLTWSRAGAQQGAGSEEGRGAEDDGPSGSCNTARPMHDPTATDTEEEEEEDAAAEGAASRARGAGSASASASASARQSPGRPGGFGFGSAVIEEDSEAATGRVSQSSQDSSVEKAARN